MITQPKYSPNGKYHSVTGKYIPLNPQKYKGKCMPIFKSNLERKMMAYLDKNPGIIEWGYEPMSIPYYDVGKKTNRKYYIDFIAKVNGGGFLKTVLIEVKSKKETIQPVKTTKQTERSFNESTKTWLTNSSKWKYARAFCKKKGYEFVIITEEQLN